MCPDVIENDCSQFIDFLTENRHSETVGPERTSSFETEIRVSEMRFSAAQIATFVTFARTYHHDLDAIWLLSGSIVIPSNPYHLPFDEWWDNFLGSYVRPEWSRVAEKVERLY
jgi:hypothetical protein